MNNLILVIISLILLISIGFLAYYLFFYTKTEEKYIQPTLSNTPSDIYSTNISSSDTISSFQFLFKHPMPQNFLNDKIQLYQTSFNTILYENYNDIKFHMSKFSPQSSNDLFYYGPFVHVNKYVQTCNSPNGCISLRDGTSIAKGDTATFYSRCYPSIQQNFCMDATPTTKDSNFLGRFQLGKTAFVSLNGAFRLDNNNILFNDVYNIYDNNGDQRNIPDMLPSLLYNDGENPVLKTFISNTNVLPPNDPNFIFYVQRGKVADGVFTSDINGPVVRIADLKYSPPLYLGFTDISQIDSPPKFVKEEGNIINWQLIPWFDLTNVQIETGLPSTIQTSFQLIAMSNQVNPTYFSTYETFIQSTGYTFYYLTNDGMLNSGTYGLTMNKLKSKIAPGYNENYKYPPGGLFTNFLNYSGNNAQIIYHENINDTQKPFIQWTAS